MTEFHATTICGVKKDGKTAIAGDGQVTMGESVIFKNSATKVRRIYGGNVVLVCSINFQATLCAPRWSLPSSGVRTKP